MGKVVDVSGKNGGCARGEQLACVEKAGCVGGKSDGDSSRQRSDRGLIETGERLIGKPKLLQRGCVHKCLKKEKRALPRHTECLVS